MHKILIALAAAGIVSLAGCQGGAAVKSEAPTQAAKPSISPEASKTLSQAEADVKSAQAQKALWLTADAALKDAKKAAEKGDSEAVIKNSKTASEQSKLGIAQLQYPVTK
ncbi:hypothetical protein [Sulfurirhabdus autotrophica]|uniref:DUF4398 domain-containing protein n=1 Tax=Sulfurirhabdus autotrophica TaxID=1706046 RepID=A0A4R3YG02_9PROT|nr:hypothetical protein [Sulfurirhabdus autotrophica]TCV90128.1 hypothetical protein EDC63_10195 [Sulfurirhabdus autotrophica]